MKKIILLLLITLSLIADNRGYLSNLDDKVKDVYEDSEDYVKNKVVDNNSWNDIDNKLNISENLTEEELEEVKNSVQLQIDNLKNDYNLTSKFEALEDKVNYYRSEQLIKDICKKNTDTEFKAKICFESTKLLKDIYILEISLVAMGFDNYKDLILDLLEPLELEKKLLELASKSKYAIKLRDLGIEVLPRKIYLNQGWNLISNPYNKSSQLNNLFCQNDEFTNINTIFIYQNKDWKTCSNNISQCEIEISSNLGFWVFSKVNTTLIYNHLNYCNYYK